MAAASSSSSPPRKKARVGGAMEAVVMESTGGPEVLVAQGSKSRPQESDLKEGQLLVSVAYAGVNFIDTYHRTGLYKVDLPFVPGREGSGTVLHSTVAAFKKGQRVVFLAGGTYAEVAVVNSAKCALVPDGVSLEDAAAVLLQGLTAHYLLTSTYPVQRGDTVLIHAGAGGTGGIMLQIAKLRGARVLTTVSTEEKAAVARKLGADEVIMYREKDVREEVSRLTEGKGCAAVYDGVGKATWEGSLYSLRRRGYLVLFGNASGAVPPIDPLMLSRNGSLFVTRPVLGDYVATPEDFRSRTEELLGWVTKGKVTVRIARKFPLAKAGDAHVFLASRAALGKVLLAIDDSEKK